MIANGDRTCVSGKDGGNFPPQLKDEQNDKFYIAGRRRDGGQRHRAEVEVRRLDNMGTRSSKELDLKEQSAVTSSSRRSRAISVLAAAKVGGIRRTTCTVRSSCTRT